MENKLDKLKEDMKLKDELLMTRSVDLDNLAEKQAKFDELKAEFEKQTAELQLDIKKLKNSIEDSEEKLKELFLRRNIKSDAGVMLVERKGYSYEEDKLKETAPELFKVVYKLDKKKAKENVDRLLEAGLAHENNTYYFKSTKSTELEFRK